VDKTRAHAQGGAACLPQLRMTAGSIRVVELDVAVARPTDHDPTLPNLVHRTLKGQSHDLRLDAELLRRSRLRRLRFWLVDHRRPGLDLALRLAGGGTTPVGLDHAGRDPEFPDVEIGVGLELNARRRQ